MSKPTIEEGYYEAKLQLRPNNEKVYDFVMARIKEEKIGITKEDRFKTGVDLYLSSNDFTFRLAKRLKKQFKGTTKVTRSLYGLDKKAGKRLYRLTVLFRLD